MANDEDLLCSVVDGVATITLNRPQARNSLTPTYLKKLIAAVERSDADDAVRVLVLRGAGKAFSSGADMSFLDDLTAMTADQIRTTVYSTFQGATRALRLCSKPVVAAVNGPAIGAGCELAVATEVAAPEDFDAAVTAFAGGLAARSRHALRAIKQALRRGLEGTMAGEWEFNVQAQSLLLTGEDFKVAVAAIRERRAPVFK
jgi:2-(1,2-epoxy-1,2-dihydrophenyl)acetyl-CoA isomerase